MKGILSLLLMGVKHSVVHRHKIGEVITPNLGKITKKIRAAGLIDLHAH